MSGAAPAAGCWRPAVFLLLAALAACSGPKQPSRIQRQALANAREAAASDDFEAAASRYRSLAEAGLPRAQRELARLYEKGLGVARDPAAAVLWYRRAAEGGDVPAMRSLAGMLLAGEGVARNPVAAAAWYRLAAEREDVAAMHRLGRLLLEGEEGVPADTDTGIAFLRQAAERGYLPAQLELADALAARGRGDDRREATRWYGRARTALERKAELGDAWASEQLGRLYLAGKGVAKSGRRAAAYFEQALEQGRESVRIRLARLYRDGEGDLPPDPERAVHHFSVAADGGNAKAAYELGRLFLEGAPGMPPDGRSAAYYFRLAAERGDARAFLRLGDLLADPELPPTDRTAARHWYLQAGLGGNGKGFFRLAQIAREEDKPDLALMYYRLAADAGYAKAEQRVARLLRQMDREEVERSAIALARFRQRNGMAPAAGPPPAPALQSPSDQP